MDSEEYAGATPNERLKEAARADDDKILLEIFEYPESFDINHQDGAGNTALHYAAKHGSLEVLEHILSHDACDVDPINTLGETPLHLALTSPELDPSPDDDDDSDEGGLREAVVDSLLDAGAAITIEDAAGRTAQFIAAKDKSLAALFQKAQLNASIARDDIVDDDDDDEDGGGSAGSDSE